MALSIIPRLNYHYTFKDLIISLSGLFKKDLNYDELKLMYKVDEVLFQSCPNGNAHRSQFNGFKKRCYSGF